MGGARRIGFPLVLLLAATAGCHDEEPGQALRNLWPNEDGASWTYAYTARVWDVAASPTLYPTRAEVPPPPTVSELAAFLPSHATGSSWQTEATTYRIAFDGLVTTASGVTAQHLASELDPVAPAVAPVAPAVAPAARADRPPDAFLARLWIARPDLRPRLRAEGLAPSADPLRADPTFEPLFLSGDAWARTDDWIGGYGDLDQSPSWKYLVAKLAAGSEFTHQLVPAVADDVFLHARILPDRTVETPAGVFDNVVVCLYLVDYGISTGTDASGVTSGYWQSISYGTVAYAAGIGPVFSYERPLMSTGDPLPPGAGDLTVGLVERTVPRR